MNDKKYIWCFMGQTKGRPTRQKMLEELRKVSGEYFEHQTSSWSSNENLSTEEYRSIIEDSIFVPCGRGNESVDTFRLYEALELGAIPIVERDDYWRNLFGDHPLITTSSEWKISNDLDALSEDKEWIKNHRLRIQNWWKSYKSNLKSRINRVVQYRESSVDCSKCAILTMSTVLDDFSRRSFDRLDQYTESKDLEHVHFEYPSSEKANFHLLKWKYIYQQLQQGDVLYIGRDLLFVGEQLNFDFFYKQGKDIVVGSQNYSDWGIKLNSNITTSFVFIKKNERTLDLLNQFVFSIQKLEKDDKFYSYQEQNVDHQLELYLKQFQNYATISNDQFAVSEEIYGKNIKHYKSYPPTFINFERNVYTEDLKLAYFASDYKSKKKDSAYANKSAREIIDYFNVDCQLTENQLTQIINEIKINNFNCNMLVFGLGYDSVIYDSINDGFTLFVEDNQEWIELNKDIKNILHFHCPTSVGESFPINEYNLSKIKMPKEISNQKWDIILIDAPAGWALDKPGRSLPIYWSSQLARNNTTIFVDDLLRKLESKYSQEFLGEDKFNCKIYNDRDGFGVYNLK